MTARTVSVVAIVFVTAFLLLPSFASAQQCTLRIPYWGGGNCPILPCTGVGCQDLCQLVSLFQRVTYLGITILVFAIAPVMVAAGGIMVLAAGGSESRFESGKNMVRNAVIGIVLGLGAFVIVNTFYYALGLATGASRMSWSTIQCSVGAYTPPSQTGGPAPAPAPTPTPTPTPQTATCQDRNSCANSSAVDRVLTCARNTATARNENLSSYFGSIMTYEGTHRYYSCHFGGRTCTDGAHAVDFGNERKFSAINADMRECGRQNRVSVICRCEDASGTSVSCSVANHIHCNVDNSRCGCT